MNGKPVYDVPAKTILNLESGFRHKLLCDGPTISCGDACVFLCMYCYVADMFRKLDRLAEILKAFRLRHGDVVVRRKNAIETLRRQMLHANGKPKYIDENKRLVVFISPTVDPAANMELVEETIEICRIVLENSTWQIRMLSKGNLLPKVAQALSEYRDRMIFGVSTGTLDDALASSFERRTPLVSKRIESLHWLQDNGFRTFGMICPSLPLASVEKYQQFAESMAKAIRADRCEHVWAEVMNARGDSMKLTIEALREAGFVGQADLLAKVSNDSALWAEYNRNTFSAHAKVYGGSPGKLRYLTYVNKTAPDAEWWNGQISNGAVIL